MEQVQPQHLDFLRKSYGNILAIKQAFDAVPQNQFIPTQDILDAVRSLSTEIEYTDGTKPQGYIFGSAPIRAQTETTQKIPYQKYTQKIVDTHDRFVTIGDTKASQLINRVDVKGLLQESLLAEGSTLAADDILQGYTEDGKRQPGLWDDISRGYAENAQGHIVTVTPHARSNRIFVETELPALLQNTDIETINGIPRQTYVAQFDRIMSDLPDGADHTRAYAKLNDDMVRPASASYLKKFDVLEFPRDYGVNPRNDFTQMATPHIDEAITNAAKPKNTVFRYAFESVKDHGGKLTALTIGAVAAGKELLGGATPAEAAEDFYETAAPYGEAQLYAARGDAVAATESALVETVSNVAFVACSIPGGVGGGIGGTAVLPGVGTVIGAGTGAMTAGTVCAVGTGIATEYAIDNAGRIIPAIKDVASYGAEQTVNGTYDLADNIARGADHVRDTVNGDLALMKEVYNAIPTVDISQTPDVTEIYDSPDIAAMVTAKSREHYHTEQMSEPDAATAYHEEQAQEWKDNFEIAFGAAKDTGTLPAVMAFITDQQATLNDHAMRDMQKNVANANNPAASEELPGNYPQQQNIGGMKL